MTQKQTILGRISQLAKANINALLDRAEDPEKMLNQLVTDFTNSIAEAEEAVSQTIANTRMAEQDMQIDREAATEWGRKAAAALPDPSGHCSRDLDVVCIQVRVESDQERTGADGDGSAARVEGFRTVIRLPLGVLESGCDALVTTPSDLG